MHVCIIGTAEDLNDITCLVRGLPADAYGQIFIMGTAPAHPDAFACPARISTNWLPGDHVAADRRLPAVLAAWAAEWMVGEPGDALRPVIWVGQHACHRIAEELSYFPDATFATIPAAATTDQPDPSYFEQSTPLISDPTPVREVHGS
ncbi:hypothetical protein GCM10011575_13120 [Microlunatus endophyticus]|uniref:Siderophore-interacting protein n=2 Tax=Microlunatus endophyticus TaxID=1716077 RepID=A0A917S5J2_9ACTN|nr:hypothetical protein GCM10011575_13120 [Microlunatus endophyticus]